METYLWMPGIGLAALIATWRWWFLELMVPKTLGRWLLATCYLVPVGALFFLGIGVDLKKTPSPAGVAFIAAFLLGVWFLTGLPMAMFKPFGAIESRKVRRAYAKRHGLSFEERRIDTHLLPGVTGLFSRRLRNVLAVAGNAYIATTLRSVTDRDRETTLCRGFDFIAVQGLPLKGLGIVVHERREYPPEKGEIQWRFKGEVFRMPLAEALGVMKTGGRSVRGGNQGPREVVDAVLETAAGGSMAILSLLKRLYLFNGRITLELEYLDTEQKLSQGVRCAKRLAAWHPPPSLFGEDS